MKDFLKIGIVILLCVFSINLCLESTSYAAQKQENTINQDPDFTYKISIKYKEKAEAWGEVITKFAMQLFGVFLIIDIILFGFNGGIGIATGSDNVASMIGKFILSVVLPAAFMYTVLNNYQEWSTEIVKGFSFIAKTAEPTLSTGNVGEGNFFNAGLDLYDKIIASASLTSPSSWSMLLVGLILLIIYTLVALQIVLIKCEAYIVLNAGIIMLGFGAFAQTRQYATNFITYVLSVSIKLFVMQLMIGIAFSFVEDFLQTPVENREISIVLGSSIVLLGLIRVIPDICSGIVHGQHVGSGNALSGAISSVASGVMGAAAMGKGIMDGGISTAKTAGAMSQTAKAASELGLSGAGKAGFMAKHMVSGLASSYMDRDPSSSSTPGNFASHMAANAESDKLSRQNKVMGSPKP